MKKRNLKIGDKILLEEAIETSEGWFVDVYATIKKIQKNGRMRLKFHGVNNPCRKFLNGCWFMYDEYNDGCTLMCSKK